MYYMLVSLRSGGWFNRKCRYCIVYLKYNIHGGTRVLRCASTRSHHFLPLRLFLFLGASNSTDYCSLCTHKYGIYIYLHYKSWLAFQRLLFNHQQNSFDIEFFSSSFPRKKKIQLTLFNFKISEFLLTLTYFIKN